MSNYEEPLHQHPVKTSRLHASFRTKHVSFQHHKSGLSDLVTVWMETHPWHILGLCLGAAGLFGYRLGLRS